MSVILWRINWKYLCACCEEFLVNCLLVKRIREIEISKKCVKIECWKRFGDSYCCSKGSILLTWISFLLVVDFLLLSLFRGVILKVEPYKLLMLVFFSCLCFWLLHYCFNCLWFLFKFFGLVSIYCLCRFDGFLCWNWFRHTFHSTNIGYAVESKLIERTCLPFMYYNTLV